MTNYSIQGPAEMQGFLVPEIGLMKMNSAGNIQKMLNVWQLELYFFIVYKFVNSIHSTCSTMKDSLPAILFFICFIGCKKEISDKTVSKEPGDNVPATSFIEYTIPEGQQFCTQSTLTLVDCRELNFKVKFDSSAIYKTKASANQLDINKLYGFSDNYSTHQEYSARFGWRWHAGKLEIFAYIYNGGKRTFSKIGEAEIGNVYNCSIKVDGDQYVFTMEDHSIKVPRESKTKSAVGYKLFPYFGGDESAPHRISIWIEDLSSS